MSRCPKASLGAYMRICLSLRYQDEVPVPLSESSLLLFSRFCSMRRVFIVTFGADDTVLLFCKRSTWNSTGILPQKRHRAIFATKAPLDTPFHCFWSWMACFCGSYLSMRADFDFTMHCDHLALKSVVPLCKPSSPWRWECGSSFVSPSTAQIPRIHLALSVATLWMCGFW